MTDLIDPTEDTAPGNAPEFTVSEISGAVKRALEDQFGRVRVRGEVGRVSRPSSGHLYLDLKDDRAVLASVVWKMTVPRLGMAPEEGDLVVAEGRLTTFPGQSKYQLVIERMSLAGEGALLAKLERLKRALAAEGLFDETRKRPVPFLPRVAGVITSPTGAVIRDILHRLADRFPMPVLLWPVAVQGPSCAPEVARALRGFNALPEGGAIPRPDVLIVARGGGSVEDLWGFNDEAVVRAIAASAIPVISAVGHETDWTLSDLAADWRAPTPTAAAERIAPVRRDLAARLAGLEERRRRCMARGLDARRTRLRDLCRALPSADGLLAGPRQRLDRAAERLPRALAALAREKRLAFARGLAGRFGPALLARAAALRRARLDDRAARLAPALARGVQRARAEAERLARRLTPARARRASAQATERLAALARALDRSAARGAAARRERLGRAARLLETLGYKATLARGYAVVRDAEGGAALTRASAVAAGRRLEIEFADGRAQATATGGADAPKRRRAPGKPAQGSLF